MISSLLFAYVRSLEVRNCSHETVRKATGILQMLERFRNKMLEDMTAEDILAWCDYRATHLTPRSRRVDYVWIRGVFRWGVAEGRIEIDPTARMRAPKVARLLPRPIKEDRLALALDKADDRMRALLGLAAFAGLRACEIASLQWSDIDFDLDEPTLRVTGKGSRERFVDISPALADILRALPHRKGPVIRRGDYSTQRNSAARLSQIGNEHLRGLGIPDTLHSLRHRAGTEAARRGGLRVAQEFLGHASPVSTAGYAAVTRKDLRPTVVAIGQLHPEAAAPPAPAPLTLNELEARYAELGAMLDAARAAAADLVAVAL